MRRVAVVVWLDKGAAAPGAIRARAAVTAPGARGRVHAPRVHDAARGTMRHEEGPLVRVVIAPVVRIVAVTARVMTAPVGRGVRSAPEVERVGVDLRRARRFIRSGSIAAVAAVAARVVLSSGGAAVARERMRRRPDRKVRLAVPPLNGLCRGSHAAVRMMDPAAVPGVRRPRRMVPVAAVPLHGLCLSGDVVASRMSAAVAQVGPDLHYSRGRDCV